MDEQIEVNSQEEFDINNGEPQEQPVINEPGSLEAEFEAFEEPDNFIDDDNPDLNPPADEDSSLRTDIDDVVEADGNKSEAPSEMDEMKRQNDILRSEITEMKRTFKQFEDLQYRSDDREFKKTFDSLETAKRQAVEDGDTDKYDSIVKEQESYNTAFGKDRDEYLDGIQADKQNIEADRIAQVEFSEWKKHNEWFDRDQKLQEYAMFVSNHLHETQKLGGVQLYNAVAKEVMERYPQSFENNSASRSRTQGNRQDNTPQTNVRSFGNLPADAKRECMEFIKDIPGFTKEEYIKSYPWGE